MSTTITGGLRSRLLERSLAAKVRAGLETLGWFDSDRQHLPINFVARQYDLNEVVPLNTVAAFLDDVEEDPVELGSNLADHGIDMWIDVYAESDSLGKHLADDIRDMLGGRLAGYTDPSIIVTDLDDVTIFVAQIENLRRERARNFPNPWQRHWFTVSAQVVDTYDGELSSSDDPFEGYPGY